MSERTREVVVATRAVAAQYWTQPFDDVLTAARGGADGLRVDTQATDKSGFWPINPLLYKGEGDEAILIRHQSGSGNCELYQQGW